MVWLFEECIVFVGNFFGLLFLFMFFLIIIWGEKLCLVKFYLDVFDCVWKLGVEILIFGYSELVRGIDNVWVVFDKMYFVVFYVRNEILNGMNDGKDVYILMCEIKLFLEICIDEYYGIVVWVVWVIWEESFGWFYYDLIMLFYGVFCLSIDEDLVEFVGGVDVLV